MVTYVAYARVSTNKQGRSGLGLEAQLEAIQRYLSPGETLLAPTYVEVESGRRADRPKLEEALSHAKLTGATLLVAKLDRLSRNARFLLAILESEVEVAFCDLPQVSGAMGRFMLTNMAAVAELEAGLISERTKAALEAARKRGVKLGGFRGHTVDWRSGLEARRSAARHHRERVKGTIDAIRREGVSSLGGIAIRLNAMGVQARRGGKWSATQVSRLLHAPDL